MDWGQLPPLIVFCGLFLGALCPPAPAYRFRSAVARSLLSLAVVLGTYFALFWLVICTALAANGCREDCENARPYPVLVAVGVFLICLTVAGAAGLHFRVWRRFTPMWLYFAIVPLAYPFLAVYAAERM
jgi:hypothetical protein